MNSTISITPESKSYVRESNRPGSLPVPWLLGARMDLAPLPSTEQGWARSPINSTQNLNSKEEGGLETEQPKCNKYPASLLYLHDVPLYLEENPAAIQGIGELACFGPYLPLQSCLSLPLAWFQSQRPCRSLNTPSCALLWAFGHGAPLPGMLFSSLCPYVAGSFLFLRINGISSEASPDPPVFKEVTPL